MALGGAQDIGNSCYYLKLGNQNILLDCGMTKAHGTLLIPNLRLLLQSNQLESMGEISQIFISHAHWDHVGYLDKLDLPSPNTGIYMTSVCKFLTEKQMYANQPETILAPRVKLQKDLFYQSLFDRITTVDYTEKLDFGIYKVRFLQAGHIPGAMMVLFHYNNRNILYTGDYSFNETSLTSSCNLAHLGRIDVLIMCGTHAKHPNYTRKINELDKKCHKLLETAQKGHSIYCRVSQLSKGVEILKRLNELNTQLANPIPIVIEPSVWSVLTELEKAKIKILVKGNYPENAALPETPQIVLGMKYKDQVTPKYLYKVVDFTLHDDFEEMKEFIKKIRPRQTLIVHSPPSRNPNDRNIAHFLARDPDINTQIIFPEEGELHLI